MLTARKKKGRKCRQRRKEEEEEKNEAVVVMMVVDGGGGGGGDCKSPRGKLFRGQKHVFLGVQQLACHIVDTRCCCCSCSVASVVSNSVRPHRQQPIRLPRPWDSPVKNTGVGCHFLLQCMKVKSESEVTQSCPTLHDPMDCSPPGSSIHGIFQARVLQWGAIAFSV